MSALNSNHELDRFIKCISQAKSWPSPHSVVTPHRVESSFDPTSRLAGAGILFSPIEPFDIINKAVRKCVGKQRFPILLRRGAVISGAGGGREGNPLVVVGGPENDGNEEDKYVVLP